MGVHIIGKNQKNKKAVHNRTIQKGEKLYVSQRNYREYTSKIGKSFLRGSNQSIHYHHGTVSCGTGILMKNEEVYS
jgi:hypothetical protein